MLLWSVFWLQGPSQICVIIKFIYNTFFIWVFNIFILRTKDKP